MTPHQDQDERFHISFSDILSLFRQSLRKIFSWALVLGIIGVLLALLTPIRYQAEGTFREKGIKGDLTTTSSVLQLLSVGNISSESEALSLIKSRRLMKEIIEKLHLQAHLEAHSEKEGLTKRIGRNLQIIWGVLTRQPQPVLKDLVCPLKIENLHYDGEIPLFLTLHLQDNGHYEICHYKQSIGWGELGKPFQFEQLSLTLAPTDIDHPLKAQSFTFTVESLTNAADNLAKIMTIESSKSDVSLLKLTCEHRNRHLANTLINTTMDCYQNYLRTHHDDLALKQLDYLNFRRDHLTQHLNEVMQEYADFLSNDLSSTGMLDSNKEMEFLAKSQHTYKEKLLASELEIKRLENFEPNNLTYYDRYSEHEDNPAVINAILENIRNLKQERDILEIELQEKALTYGSEHLKHSSEYRGINLKVAGELYFEYAKELIQIESTIRQNLFFIHQIEDPNFEITSLSLGLVDPVGEQMILKASELVLRLRDQNNQSTREQERIKEDLNQQRFFLKMHLKQMVQLMELNKMLIEEKVFALQTVSLELIHQQVTLLEKNLQDYMQSRLHNLEQEGALIKHQLQNLHAEMANLPKKWTAEKRIEQEVMTNQLIVEEIAKLVESKNIAHNLEVIQSTPIDVSFPPVHPLVPHVFLWGFIGFFLGGSLGSGIVIGQTLNKGLKVSAHNLKLMGCHVSGVLISPLHSSTRHQLQLCNLETLRRLQAYVDTPLSTESQQAKLLLLLEGQGPHYAPDLADLFLKRGKRILTLDLDFQEETEHSTSGLLHYLQGEILLPTIQKSRHGDWIAAGGSSPFAVEMLGSPAFQRLLEQLSSDYDWILATSRAFPCSVEAESLVPLFPYIAITLEQEKTEEISFYLHFREQSSQHKLTFILAAGGGN